MKKFRVMAYNPMIFEVEANTFKEAKEKIINKLFESKDAALTTPMHFEEITEIEIKDEESKSKTNNEREGAQPPEEPKESSETKSNPDVN